MCRRVKWANEQLGQFQPREDGFELGQLQTPASVWLDCLDDLGQSDVVETHEAATSQALAEVVYADDPAGRLGGPVHVVVHLRDAFGSDVESFLEHVLAHIAHALHHPLALRHRRGGADQTAPEVRLLLDLVQLPGAVVYIAGLRRQSGGRVGGPASACPGADLHAESVAWRPRARVRRRAGAAAAGRVGLGGPACDAPALYHRQAQDPQVLLVERSQVRSCPNAFPHEPAEHRGIALRGQHAEHAGSAHRHDLAG
mmetsp:Transcript_44276/g.134193  ORF Transcript_44276/g.134193 Transcript_44276/m.134193 type:complete len:256 (-) Transcript_44276:193-960(-)